MRSPEAERGAAAERPRARAIAFYLPQFHPIPENDGWWGPGFTEWTNVARARPLFRGHHQPQLPADLGFYDLRLAETREAQAALARGAGIEGFCYWHYWFEGKRLLERPFNEVLASGQPDFPFCLAWANESWSRRWDGQEQQLLQRQSYGGEADARAHFRALLPAFEDRRYLRVEGRPLFLIYKPADLPEPERFLAIWRDEARLAGLPGLTLLAVETPGQWSWRAEMRASLGLGRRALPGLADPEAVGFDGVVLYPPSRPMLARHWLGHLVRRGAAVGWGAVQRRLGGRPAPINTLLPYERGWRRAVAAPRPAKRWYPGVMPAWDNSARRANGGAHIFTGASPESYAAWLSIEVARLAARAPEERLLFINAWNEWAEGCHLEPDRRDGHAYLEATRRVLLGDGGAL